MAGLRGAGVDLEARLEGAEGGARLEGVGEGGVVVGRRGLEHVGEEG